MVVPVAPQAHRANAPCPVSAFSKDGAHPFPLPPPLPLAAAPAEGTQSGHWRVESHFRHNSGIGGRPKLQRPEHCGAARHAHAATFDESSQCPRGCQQRCVEISRRSRG